MACRLRASAVFVVAVLLLRATKNRSIDYEAKNTLTRDSVRKEQYSSIANYLSADHQIDVGQAIKKAHWKNINLISTSVCEIEVNDSVLGRARAKTQPCRPKMHPIINDDVDD